MRESPAELFHRLGYMNQIESIHQVHDIALQATLAYIVLVAKTELQLEARASMQSGWARLHWLEGLSKKS